MMTNAQFFGSRGWGRVTWAMLLFAGGPGLLAFGCGGSDAKKDPGSSAGGHSGGAAGSAGAKAGAGGTAGVAGAHEIAAGAAGEVFDEGGVGGEAGEASHAGGGGMPGDVAPPWPTLCTGPQRTGWCWMTAASGTAVAFKDDLNGVLANGPAFFRTADGGNTWFLAKIDTADAPGINDIEFASPTVAVAVGTRSNSTPVTLRSADAGVTWTTVPSGATVPLQAVSFGSAAVGAAVGAAGQIVYTTDGGQSWIAATVPTASSLQSVAFATASIAVASASDGGLFRSTDGGENWTALAPVGTSSAALSIKFVSETTGFYVNGDGIRRSDDAGVTWSLIGGTSALDEIDFGDALHGVAVGAFAKSVVTSDGGVTWTTPAFAQENLHAVSFAGESTVIALGQAIQRSTDSGKSWGKTSPLVDALPPSINSLRYADAKTAVAVGGTSYGMIWRTTDGGSTWTEVPTPSTDALAAVDFASPTIAAAVGRGVIVRSVDSGATWTVAASDPSRRLYAIRFASAQVGVAMGALGLVLRTTDAGATWTPVVSPSSGSASFTAAAFSSPTDGVIGDDNGKIFRTTDSGLTWTPALGDAGAFQTVTSIGFADAKTAIAVGSHGFVLRSTDGGATWSGITPANPQSPDIAAVAFASPTLGYALVGTLIWRTEDGGKSWSEPFPPLPTRFSALDFTDAKNGLIGGSFGSFLRTTTGGQ